jgi:hypothetical protein
LVCSTAICFAYPVYYFAYSTANDKTNKYAVLSDLIQAEWDVASDTSLEIRVQFHDWIKAYVKKCFNIDYFKFNEGILGPYDTKKEANKKRLDQISVYQKNKYIFVDLKERDDLPEFEFYSK